MEILRRISQSFNVDSVQNGELLATRILNDAEKENLDNIEEISEIVNSENFKCKPVDYLLELMIARGILGNQPNDSARQYVIKKIPNFVQILGSDTFLIKSAKNLFAKSLNKSKQIDVFKLWLSKDAWRQSFNENLKNLNEQELRVSLNIYRRAEHLQAPIETPQKNQGAEDFNF